MLNKIVISNIFFSTCNNKILYNSLIKFNFNIFFTQSTAHENLRSTLVGI